MPVQSFNAAASAAESLAYTVPTMKQRPLDAHNEFFASADKFTKPAMDNLLALIYGAVAEYDFLQAYTCASGNAVDDAVQLTGNLTVAKALGNVNAPILGFIRHKGTLGAASSGASTTAYLVPFLKKTGLSGGTAGGPVYITDAGGYSSTPGTYVIRAGTWISTTEVILFASPAAGLDGSALSVLGRAANTAGALASIVAGTDGHVLRRSGTTLGFGLVVAAGLDALNALTDADVGLTDEFPVYSAAAAANRNLSAKRVLGYANPGICNGRLTLETGVPVSTSDQIGKTTIYFTLHNGNRISLWDGTRWDLYTFTERSLALGTLTSGKNYDVFIFDNAGTLTLELSAAWSTDTARTDALTTQDGIYLKSGLTNRRYLGTIRTTAATTTEDSKTKRFVWNMYNQVPRKLRKAEPGDSWTYASSTYRYINNNTNDPVVRAIVGKTGFCYASIFVDMSISVASVGANAGNVGIGVGAGSGSTTNEADSFNEIQNWSGAASILPAQARLDHVPTEGLVEYCGLESTRAGSLQFVGDGATPNNNQSAIVGWVLG